MKRFALFLLVCLTLTDIVDAQTFISMRPNWTFNPPIAENNTYEYYVSTGVGDTEADARKDAFIVSVKELQLRIGVGQKTTEIFNAFQHSEKDFNVIAGDFNVPMKEVCHFSEKLQDGRWHYYQLLQIAVKGNIHVDFKPFNGDCYDFSKAIELRKIFKKEYSERIRDESRKAQKNAQNQKRLERQRKRLDNSYCDKNKHRYVAWNITGSGYPWNLVSGVHFRYGSIVGFGAYLDLGMDFTHIQVHRPRESEIAVATKTAFKYAGGVKFFPYKGLSLDCGYGTIAKPFEEVEYDYNHNTEGPSNRIKKISKKISNSHGLLFHLGYDFVTNLSNGAGFYLGLNAGASYDIRNKAFAPSANIRIGVAWGVK